MDMIQRVLQRIDEVGPIAPYGVIVFDWGDYQRASEGERAELERYIHPWRLVEEESLPEAVKAFENLDRECEALRYHCLIARSSVLWTLRDNCNFGLVLAQIQETISKPDLSPVLRATAALLLAKWQTQIGKSNLAFDAFADAFRFCPSKHVLRSELFDALGLLCSRLCLTFISRMCFQAAIQAQGDRIEAKLATLGRFGSALFQWGMFDQAEKEFREHLRLAMDADFRNDQVHGCIWLGRICLARAQLNPTPTNNANAVLLDEAEAWLKDGLKLSALFKLKIRAAYAHLALAELYLLRGDADSKKAEDSLEIAREEFERAGFAKGQAAVHLTRGLLLAKDLNLDTPTVQDEMIHRFDRSKMEIGMAIRIYSAIGDFAGVARARCEAVRIFKKHRFSRPMLLEYLKHALEEAEKYLRKSYLIRQLEMELLALDSVAYSRRLYEKSRGRYAQDESSEQIEPRVEVATILFLDLIDSCKHANAQKLESYIDLLNSLMGEFYTRLSPYEARIEFRGDGFLAGFRGNNHATRAFLGAKEMLLAIEEINRPLEWLGLPTLGVRCGIATAEVVFGCVGAYDKVDFTCIGPAANLAARLQGEARSNQACLNRLAYEVLRERDVVPETDPSEVSSPLKGFENERIVYHLDPRRDWKGQGT